MKKTKNIAILFLLILGILFINRLSIIRDYKNNLMELENELYDFANVCLSIVNTGNTVDESLSKELADCYRDLKDTIYRIKELYDYCPLPEDYKYFDGWERYFRKTIIYDSLNYQHTLLYSFYVRSMDLHLKIKTCCSAKLKL